MNQRWWFQRWTINVDSTLIQRWWFQRWNINVDSTLIQRWWFQRWNVNVDSTLIQRWWFQRSSGWLTEGRQSAWLYLGRQGDFQNVVRVSTRLRQAYSICLTMLGPPCDYLWLIRMILKLVYNLPKLTSQIIIWGNICNSSR